MWQEIAIIFVGLFIILYVGFKCYRMLTHPTNPCHGCSGCSLKEIKNKQQNQCKTYSRAKQK